MTTAVNLYFYRHSPKPPVELHSRFGDKLLGIRLKYSSLCSAGMYVPAENTGTIAATGTTPDTATLVNLICAKRFHRHL